VGRTFKAFGSGTYLVFLRDLAATARVLRELSARVTAWAALDELSGGKGDELSGGKGKASTASAAA